jgi:hypothetical protein
MWIYLSLLVCLIGLVGYALINQSTNPKASTICLNCFWCGLLAFLLEVGSGRVIALH